MKWVVDPGLDGDVYADKPYLYGPAASSVNTLFIGSKDGKDEEVGLVFEEGGDEEGLEVRHEMGVPDTDAARKKHFLTEERRKEWEWEQGRTYGCDFFNPYLDFNGMHPVLLRRRNLSREKLGLTLVLDFALRLPGFTLPIMKYWDGQSLRYALPLSLGYFDVLFVLLPSTCVTHPQIFLFQWSSRLPTCFVY